MTSQSTPNSLESLIQSTPNFVDFLYRNPPKTPLNVFSVMMPTEVVRLEYTTWRDEQRSWRETIALHDQSFHMNSLHLRGRKALPLLQQLGVNTFKNFSPGRAKQFLCCSPEGYVIGDAILYYLEPEHLLLVGNPASTDWVHYNAEKAGVETELDPMWVINRNRKRNYYRFQLEGPNAYKLLEQLHGEALPEIKFFHAGELRIAGKSVRAMRHSMGGVPGLELSGPWQDREAVRSTLLEAGKAFGIRAIGSLAYFSTVIESGWWAVPFSAIYTSPELKGYREWLTTKSASARLSLGGSFYSPNIEDYYLTPWDIGHGHLIKYDHDFVGRQALEKMHDLAHRRKVTLMWNADDVAAAQRTLLTRAGKTAMHIEMPVSATARLHYDRVLSKEGATIGVAHYPGYSVNERSMMSLGSIAEDYSRPGTEVAFLWGEDGGGERSGSWIEPHQQVKIRAIVAPSPISRAAQEYRTTIGVAR
jgi:vanillate/3-O-methylgallate O-demethylase